MLERDDLEALALEAPDHFADEAALDGVGLAEDERAISGLSHGGSRLQDAQTALRTGDRSPRCVGVVRS